jgi:hypothetical protein
MQVADPPLSCNGLFACNEEVGLPWLPGLCGFYAAGISGIQLD